MNLNRLDGSEIVSSFLDRRWDRASLITEEDTAVLGPLVGSAQATNRAPWSHFSALTKELGTRLCKAAALRSWDTEQCDIEIFIG